MANIKHNLFKPEDPRHRQFSPFGVEKLYRHYITHFPGERGSGLHNYNCPFCGVRNTVKVWQFNQNGHRCKSCGAMLTKNNAYVTTEAYNKYILEEKPRSN